MGKAAQGALQSNFVPLYFRRLGAWDSRWRPGPPQGRACSTRSTHSGEGGVERSRTLQCLKNCFLVSARTKRTDARLRVARSSSCRLCLLWGAQLETRRSQHAATARETRAPGRALRPRPGTRDQNSWQWNKTETERQIRLSRLKKETETFRRD